MDTVRRSILVTLALLLGATVGLLSAQGVEVKHYVGPVTCEADFCTQQQVLIAADGRASTVVKMGTRQEVFSTVEMYGEITNEVPVEALCFEIAGVNVEPEDPEIRGAAEAGLGMAFCFAYDPVANTLTKIDVSDPAAIPAPMGPPMEACGEPHSIPPMQREAPPAWGRS